MHTLIFDGSPHKNGDTAALIGALRENLRGESTVIRAYGSAVSPCIDCRACWKREGCALQDGMQEIYALIEKSDAIVIASPVYYSELTGPLLSLLSRLQMYYCNARFLGVRKNTKKKRGGILLAGGGNGGPEKALETARLLLSCMNVREISLPVSSLQTDTFPARRDEGTLAAARKLGEEMERPL